MERLSAFHTFKQEVETGDSVHSLCVRLPADTDQALERFCAARTYCAGTVPGWPVRFHLGQGFYDGTQASAEEELVNLFVHHPLLRPSGYDPVSQVLRDGSVLQSAELPVELLNAPDWQVPLGHFTHELARFLLPGVSFELRGAKIHVLRPGGQPSLSPTGILKKEPSLVAWLLCRLPSLSQGGALELLHPEGQFVWPSPADAPAMATETQSLQWLAFFHDLPHVFQPVKTGVQVWVQFGVHLLSRTTDTSHEQVQSPNPPPVLALALSRRNAPESPSRLRSHLAELQEPDIEVWFQGRELLWLADSKLLHTAVSHREIEVWSQSALRPLLREALAPRVGCDGAMVFAALPLRHLYPLRLSAKEESISLKGRDERLRRVCTELGFRLVVAPATVEWTSRGRTTDPRETEDLGQRETQHLTLQVWRTATAKFPASVPPPRRWRVFLLRDCTPFTYVLTERRVETTFEADPEDATAGFQQAVTSLAVVLPALPKAYKRQAQVPSLSAAPPSKRSKPSLFTPPPKVARRR